ncbi:MAG: diaminopimelate epimerase [Actinomycetota bacterium]|nr:diaminopimelate epimerase [Actinomycetota bacterium]
MEFEKWHGVGNDFILIADIEDRVDLSPEVVKRLCDRRFGIGADGVIRVAPGSDGAELFMDYVNSDGSLGEMCGNGIRCLALFARDQGLTTSDQIKVGTRAGLRTVWIEGELVRVDMGAPIFGALEIPVKSDDPLHTTLDTSAGRVEAAVVGMGNPHAVLFVDDPDDVPVTTLGPEIERLGPFPNGTNVEWVAVESPHRVRMRVWERGSGQTLACGTGSCAAAVAARVLHDAEEVVTVSLPGGEVQVEWGGSLERETPVFLIGAAERTFRGVVDLEDHR